MPTFDGQVATALAVARLVGGRTGVCTAVCAFQLAYLQEGSVIVKREFVLVTS